MHAEAGAVMDTFGKGGGGRSRSSSKEREAAPASRLAEEVVNIPKVYPAAHQSCRGQIWVARRQTANILGSFKAGLDLKN